MMAAYEDCQLRCDNFLRMMQPDPSDTGHLELPLNIEGKAVEYHGDRGGPSMECSAMDFPSDSISTYTEMRHCEVRVSGTTSAIELRLMQSSSITAIFCWSELSSAQDVSLDVLRPACLDRDTTA